MGPYDDSDGPGHRGGCGSLDDLGGLVCPDGTVFTTAQAPTQGGGSVVDTILTLIDRALASAEELRLHVAGIGVGLPGLVDVERGFMRSMPCAWLHELGDVPLVARRSS